MPKQILFKLFKILNIIPHFLKNLHIATVHYFVCLFIVPLHK